MDNSSSSNGLHARDRHRRTAIRVALLTGCILSPLAWSAASSTWKWQNADGSVTYGDTPPLGAAAEQVRVHIGSSSTMASDPSMGAVDSQGAAADATQVAATTGVSPERSATLCQQAKANLSVLDSSALIRQTDESGEARILNETEKKTQKQTAKEVIRYHCR